MVRRRPPVTDPRAAALIRLARQGDLSRRALLGTVGLGGAAAALSACAPPAPPAGGGLTSLELPTDLSAKEKVVRFANWTAYLDYDEDKKVYPTLEAFEKKYGITASYA